MTIVERKEEAYLICQSRSGLYKLQSTPTTASHLVPEHIGHWLTCRCMLGSVRGGMLFFDAATQGWHLQMRKKAAYGR